MRLLRLSLLSSYLVYLNKNKRTALRFINLGIFLCIFAVSTAGISFFIENKISKKQTELLYLQIEDKYYTRFISEFQTAINNYTTLLVFEDNYKVEKEYLAQANIESQLLTALDFFGPYTYANLISSKEFLTDKEFLEFLDPNSDYAKDMIANLESGWDKEHVDQFKNALENVSKSYLEFSKINIENYKLKKFQSLDDIVFEISNYENNNVYKNNSKYSDDYLSIKGFFYDLIFYLEETLQVISSLKASIQKDIKIINTEIIILSSNEKNYIFGTFVIQFFIFLIIQFFEVNSINLNLLKIRGKHAKKNK